MTKRHTARRRAKTRQLIALLMGILGLWTFSLTGSLNGLQGKFTQLGSQSSVTVGIFPLPLEGNIYGLLPSSALLSAGREAVTQRLATAKVPIATLPSTPNIPTPQVTVESPIYAQGDDDDTDTPHLPVAQAEDVVNYTAAGDDSGNFISANSLYVANRSKQKISSDFITNIMSKEDYILPQGAKILILHTHGTEAYTPAGTDIYLESDPYRTTDNQQNIVRVGEEMSRILRQAGFQVLHDTNLYDYPDYNSSYTNSRVAAEQWLAQYPDIALILDVHRDALTNKNGDPYRLVSDDSDGAQLMLVVGCDDTLSHPNWEDNFALALQLQGQLTQDWGTISRPTTLRSSRYNQDLSPHFLLLEVGGHGNSLQDALIGGKHFAQSLITALSSPKEVNP